MHGILQARVDSLSLLQGELRSPALQADSLPTEPQGSPNSVPKEEQMVYYSIFPSYFHCQEEEFLYVHMAQW